MTRITLPTAVLLAGVLLAPALARAAQYQLADGRVRFQVPDAWPQIMVQDSGNPQFMAFQVPDPSPVGRRVLARVTVTVEQMTDLAAFRRWVSQRLAHSQRLPGYQAEAGGRTDPSAARYKAMESGVPMRYSERYYFRAGEGVQLRCLRPARSDVDAAWVVRFDRGCDAIAASLQRGG